MNIKFAIGAPSLTGKGAHEEAETTISGMEFPCSLHVANHMPRAAVFPESGVELASTLAGSGHTAEVTFVSAVALKRLLRTASEVAELNGYELALVVTDEDPLAITDEELALQVIEQAPELKEEVEVAGGADAAATLASTDAGESDAADADADAAGDAVGEGEQGDSNEASSGEGEAPTDGAEINTASDGEGAGGEASEAGETPAPVVEQAEAPKAGGKRSKNK